MKPYTVKYREYKFSAEQTIIVLADNKADAYDKATYEEIPKAIGTHPYSAWVSGVTYNNGNYKTFNTSEGNAY